MDREDLFSGVWKLNPERSTFDPNHHPLSAIMYWERDSAGYQMRAQGTGGGGQEIRERPQRFILDGKDYPVPEAPGVTVAATRPDPNTIQVEAKNASAVVGTATYAVSHDGATLTATVSGTDAEQRPVLVWDRE